MYFPLACCPKLSTIHISGVNSEMAKPQKRIFRRIARQFESLPIKTFSNRVLGVVDVLITMEDVSERALNRHETCYHTSV